jgi:hypothetical protein
MFFLKGQSWDVVLGSFNSCVGNGLLELACGSFLGHRITCFVANNRQRARSKGSGRKASLIHLFVGGLCEETVITEKGLPKKSSAAICVRTSFRG